MAGEANLTQVCEALRRYSEQESLLREVLVHLYKYTSEIERSQPDILKVREDICLLICFPLSFERPRSVVPLSLH